MTNIRRGKLFISYGRKDTRDFAMQLRSDLLATGHEVWMDLEEIPGGGNWSEQLEVAIDDCDITLALLSHASLNSQWCRAEQLRSIRKGKQIIPILVQSDAEPPIHLEHLNFLDFSNADQYHVAFRDLLSDIVASFAIEQPTANLNIATQTQTESDGQRYQGEKRGANAFRRYLAELRQEPWLGSRYWWTYFLFAYVDLHTTIDILEQGLITAEQQHGTSTRSHWNRFVRLYFRPRIPDLYHLEGFNPSAMVEGKPHIPIPICLLFDLESIICMPGSRFAEVNPAKQGRQDIAVYSTPRNFQEMPFEQIYHDTSLMPAERAEILQCREAQVILPEQIGLETLQMICVRSAAEYETLSGLLTPATWQQWRDKVVIKPEYNIFHHHHWHVDSAQLTAASATLNLNYPVQPSTESMTLSIVVQGQDTMHEWMHETYPLNQAIQIEWDQPIDHYSIQCIANGELAYRGLFRSSMQIY